LSEEVVVEVKVNREDIARIKKEWKDADIQKFLEEVARIVVGAMAEITEFKKTNKKWAAESFAEYFEGKGAELFRTYIIGQRNSDGSETWEGGKR
jgi:hypothetical protein